MDWLSSPPRFANRLDTLHKTAIVPSFYLKTGDRVRVGPNEG
jgi:hypothetical protein